MSRADQIFVDMCRDIIDNGTSTEGEKVRPHWEDGSLAYTVKKFGVVNRYNLREEFPASYSNQVLRPGDALDLADEV